MLVGADDRTVRELFQRLEFMKAHIAAPLLLATLLVELKMDGINERIDQCYAGIRTVKFQTGLAHTPNMPSTSQQVLESNEDVLAIDPTMISKDLTRIRAKLAQCRQYLEVLQPVVDYLDEAGDQCAEVTQSEQQKERARAANYILKTINSWNLKYMKSTTARTAFLMERATAYVQTVSNRLSFAEDTDLVLPSRSIVSLPNAIMH